MKIRSITYFCNPGWPLDEKVLRAAGEFLAKAKSAYEAAGYEVQTTRLATIPFPNLFKGKLSEAPKLADALSKLLPQVGIAYACLGPALTGFPESYAVIPEAIAASENIFFGGKMTSQNDGQPSDSKIHLAAVRACAEIIVQCAPLDPNGFANLRFAALANVPPGAPFFPAAYHEGNEPAFAIATEAAVLAVEAFTGRRTTDPSTSLRAGDGRRALIAEIEKHGKAIARVAEDLSRFPIPNSRLPVPDAQFPKFGGIDFSLAPFPDNAHSLGNAVEKMGIPKIGLHGSLAAAALLTEAVDRADFPHTGFSGFMPPVLEDSVLAKRAAEGTLTIKDLLLYSTVCGTGLDTVPLPGDTTAEQITPLLLDLCALALRLDKPLTARLMPVPGKKAGDETTFDFGFFANSKVTSLAAEALHSPLNGDETIEIRKR
jgi:hypothetical protein